MGFDANAWNQGGGDSRPASGVYEARVTDTDIIERQADGEPFVKLSWRALSGPSAGIEWDQVKPAKGKGVFYTKAILQALGYDVDAPVESYEDMQERLDRLVGVQAVVKVDSSGPYDDTEVLRRLAGDEAAHPEGVPPDVPGARDDEFVHPEQQSLESQVDEQRATVPPQKGDIDPDTGEPLPY